MAPLLSESLVFFPSDYTDKESLLTYLSEQLQAQGVVSADYLATVLAREAVYPTGLQTNAQIGCALPHGEMETVKRPGIALAILKEPVIFGQMANSEIDVAVSLVFLLAINDGQQQVATLQQLMKLLQSDTQLHLLKNAQSTAEVMQLFASF